jgi:hypothetical protein
MIYELQCEGRTFYCNSSDVVSALIEMGWSVSVTRQDGRACGGESAPRRLRCSPPPREGSAHLSVFVPPEGGTTNACSSSGVTCSTTHES